MKNFDVSFIKIDGREFPILTMPTSDAQNEQWVVEESKTDDGWLEVHDPEGWRKAIVREDGCVHYYRYHNVPCTERDDEEHPQLTDYLHICNIDEEIDRLRQLKAMAQAHYGVMWE